MLPRCKRITSYCSKTQILLRQDSIALASLRQSVVDEQVGVKKISAQIADEHEDVKKISAKISTLIAKVELAAKCNNPGSDFLHFSKARSKPTIPSNAQKDGPAVYPCGTYFAWRSPAKSPGYHASPTKLRNKRAIVRGFGPAPGQSAFALRASARQPSPCARTHPWALPPRRLACRAEARRAKAGRRRQIRTADPLGVNEML